MGKLPTMTIPEALTIIRPHMYGDSIDERVSNAFNTIETALLQSINRPWHICSYEDGELFQDGSWISGKWYEWLDKFNNREIARMKADSVDHFFPNTRVITEKNVIAFREIDRERYE